MKASNMGTRRQLRQELRVRREGPWMRESCHESVEEQRLRIGCVPVVAVNDARASLYKLSTHGRVAFDEATQANWRRVAELLAIALNTYQAR